MAGEFMQIVGANGQLMDQDEGHLALIVSGIESGSLDGSLYEVGATMARNITQRKGATATTTRFAQLRPPMRVQPPYPMAPIAQPVQVNLAPQGPQVQATGVGAMREVTQGLDSGPVLILPGETRALQFNASMLFRPSRLMVPPGYAPLFTIDDLKVASDSLFLSTGAVPAENFLPNAVTASALKRRTAQPGTPITVLVTNIDGAPHRFRASIFGEASDAANCA